MRIRLPADQHRRLQAALRRAGSREIGGQLYAEQLAPSDFRLVEVTVQSHGSSFVRFVVDVVQAARDAARFFRRTERAYTRYNYLGEWHSHPAFAVVPSGTDVQAMVDLVTDPDYPSTFAVLAIVRLDGERLVHGSWIFERSGRQLPATLEVENDRPY